MIKEFNYAGEVNIIKKHKREYQMLNANRSWDDMILSLKKKEVPIDAVRYLRCNLQIISAREKNIHLNDDEIKEKVIRLHTRGMSEKDIQFEVGLNHGTVKKIINNETG